MQVRGFPSSAALHKESGMKLFVRRARVVAEGHLPSIKEGQPRRTKNVTLPHAFGAARGGHANGSVFKF
jgi:hypothetical protein